MLTLTKLDQEPVGKRRWRAYIELPADWKDVADADALHAPKDAPKSMLIITAANADVLDDLARCLAEAAEEARSLGHQAASFWKAE